MMIVNPRYIQNDKGYSVINSIFSLLLFSLFAAAVQSSVRMIKHNFSHADILNERRQTLKRQLNNPEKHCKSKFKKSLTYWECKAKDIDSFIIFSNPSKERDQDE